MAKLSGYKKCVKWVKESSGFRKLSQWTHATSVEMSDGTTLQDKLKTIEDGITSHTNQKGNVHNLTKSDIGLGNVDNTADSAKSVKYATSAGTADSAKSVSWDNVSGKPENFNSASHNHDERYYTESEVDTKLNSKANSSHTHDDRYFTESEINSMLSGYSKAKFSYDSSSGTLTITN